jgi:formylglycine-generating enzyme required for sulfatase activity
MLAVPTSGDCSRRVLRGGSWDLNPEFLRSANRAGNFPDDQYYFVGFRVARTLR